MFLIELFIYHLQLVTGVMCSYYIVVVVVVYKNTELVGLCTLF